MAIQLLKPKFISSPGVSKPLYNEMGGLQFDDMQRYVQKKIIAQIRNTPELVAMLDTVVTEHFGGEVDFYDEDGGSLGATKLKQIRRFWSDNEVQEKAFYGAGIDFFTDGSAFGWIETMRNLTNDVQKSVLSALRSSGFSRVVDESLDMPRSVSYLAASTVEIQHNEYGIHGYKQDASGKQKFWTPDQVVYCKLMEFNGEVRGFSGLKSLIKEIAIMYLLKENLISSLQNGGSPDNIISLKGANGVSKARFNRLRTALESFSHVRKSHGNMPIDAEVDVIPLGTQVKDMEYRELAMFAISEFCLALGMPTSRVPFMMVGSGGTSNKGELSGQSEDGYEEKKCARRKKWENSWNRKLRKAGFTFRFRNTNLQNEVRETQASAQRAAYVQTVQASLSQNKKKLTIPAHLALLSGSKVAILEEDIEDIPKEDLIMQQPGTGGADKNSMKPSKVDMKARTNRDRSDAKKGTATNNGVNA